MSETNTPVYPRLPFPRPLFFVTQHSSPKLMTNTIKGEKRIFQENLILAQNRTLSCYPIGERSKIERCPKYEKTTCETEGNRGGDERPTLVPLLQPKKKEKEKGNKTDPGHHVTMINLQRSNPIPWSVEVMKTYNMPSNSGFQRYQYGSPVPSGALGSDLI